MKKNILLVAMPNSIHTVRWINQIPPQEWTIHLFSSTGIETTHPKLSGATLQYPVLSKWRNRLQQLGFPKIAFMIDWIRRHYELRFPNYRVVALNNIISQLRPILIHSIEMQSAGYLTLEAKKKYRGKFPPWIVTNWGSDIFLFGRLAAHCNTIREVLSYCNYYSCECQRDVELARSFGFNGTTLPVFPNTGGFNLNDVSRFRKEKTSDRRLIMLKGYQNWAGRALVGLRALERCAELLTGYEIAIYSGGPEVDIAAELFSQNTGIRVRLIPKDTPHHEILKMHGESRISIGISISDAISTSLLEAMVMGSFPIQSCTACANEWIEHGVSGIIVPPEDPDIIERALRNALTDDELVNKAAEINWQTALTRLDDVKLKKQVAAFYSLVAVQTSV